MRVLLLNGGPHPKGCTFTALEEIQKTLNENGVETEIFQAGTQPLRGCTGCGGCFRNKDNRCVFDDDIVNRFLSKAEQFDGYIFGSPVHFAASAGTIKSLLDRSFYAGKEIFQHKPASAIVSCRRAGSTAALEQLNKYICISNMVFVTSQYWNMVHGRTPEEVRQDEEGMQIMRTLGRNMAWILSCMEAGREKGISRPEAEPPARTNFIR